jgi:hypothetical protein
VIGSDIITIGIYNNNSGVVFNLFGKSDRKVFSEVSLYVSQDQRRE